MEIYVPLTQQLYFGGIYMLRNKVAVREDI